MQYFKVGMVIPVSAILVAIIILLEGISYVLVYLIKTYNDSNGLNKFLYSRSAASKLNLLNIIGSINILDPPL